MTEQSQYVSVRLSTGKEQEGEHDNGNSIGFRMWFKEVKGAKDGTGKRPKLPDHFAVVPRVRVTCEPAELQKSLQAHLDSVAESIVKDAIISRYERNGKCEPFTLAREDFSAAHIAAYLSAAERAAKLNGDMIRQWAKETELSDLLLVTVGDKIGADLTTPEGNAKASKLATAFIEGLAKLASPNYISSTSKAVAAQLQSALALADPDHSVTAQLSRRLENILTRDDEVQLLSL